MNDFDQMTVMYESVNAMPGQSKIDFFVDMLRNRGVVFRKRVSFEPHHWAFISTRHLLLENNRQLYKEDYIGMAFYSDQDEAMAKSTGMLSISFIGKSLLRDDRAVSSVDCANVVCQCAAECRIQYRWSGSPQDKIILWIFPGTPPWQVFTLEDAPDFLLGRPI